MALSNECRNSCQSGYIYRSMALSFRPATCLVGQAQRPIAAAKADQTGITVAFSGRLDIGAWLKPDADPATQLFEVAAHDLNSAAVESGGTMIWLDWNQSHKICNELLSSSKYFGDGGPNPSVQAMVSGRMVFKPLKEVARHILPPSVTDDTPVPVVMVESIQIQFVRSDGKHYGDARNVVTAD